MARAREKARGGEEKSSSERVLQAEETAPDPNRCIGTSATRGGVACDSIVISFFWASLEESGVVVVGGG